MSQFAAIGAHIYAGGFSVGVSKHFDVLAHLEHNGYGAEVVKLNYPELPIYAGGPSSWPTTWSKGPARPRFLYANPPCAIWSSASMGRAVTWRDDPRLQMHRDIFDYAIGGVGVDVLAMESVPPSFTTGRPHVNELVQKASDAGYSATVVMHDAQHLGVAQTRSRIFYVFHKMAISWDFSFGKLITVREAFKGLGRQNVNDPALTQFSGSIMNLLRQAKPGENLRRVYERTNPDPELNARGHRVGAPAFLDKRMHWDRPAPVIITQKIYHPEECRLPTLKELAAVCSFPQDYKWPVGVGNRASSYMSRGVMPKVGEWLAGNVARALEANRRINEPRAEVLDITGPPGRLYPLQPKEENMARGVQVVAPKTGLPDRADGEGSGAYMRRLLALGADDAAILERVHAQFPGSKATKSDVSYNRAKLKRDGAQPVAEARPPGKVPKYDSKVGATHVAAAQRAQAPWEPQTAKPLSGAVTTAGAVSALRAVVAKRATGGLAAMLTLSLDLMEKL